jgi:hypothetical protein
VATILLANPAQQREFQDSYCAWAKAATSAEIIVMPSQGTGPHGEHMYCGVPSAFLDYLRTHAPDLRFTEMSY